MWLEAHAMGLPTTKIWKRRKHYGPETGVWSADGVGRSQIRRESDLSYTM
jgi:hypothetical protein